MSLTEGTVIRVGLRNLLKGKIVGRMREEAWMAEPLSEACGRKNL